MKQQLRVFLTLLLCAVASVGWADTYQKYSGEITEGDYIVVYNVYAMKAEIVSDRLQYSSVGSQDVITVTDASLVWTIAADGDYYTLYNKSTGKYAASTGAKNKAKLESSVTDNCLWTVTGDATYEFVNKVNKEKNVNSNLRLNEGYGFACYATSTGGALTLYKKVEAAGPVDVNITFGEDFQVEVGKTATNTITGKPDDLTLSFESDKTNIATVDNNGAVTGVAEGTATITASWDAVANKYNAGSASYTVNVIPEKQAVIFEKVTSANQLVAGNEYILVATGENKAMGAQGNNLRTPVDVTISDNKISILDEEVAVLTLGGTPDAWSFYASDNNKYISLNSASNALHTSDEVTDGALWTITDDFRLKNNKQTNYILQYNSASPRFACYTSSQKPVYLFMKQGGTVETKTAPEFSFGETTAFTVNAGADFTAPTLSYAEGYDGTVTYSSSNEDIAVVDANSGEVVIGDKAGTVTITASAPATDNFLAGEASYTITVVKPLTIAEFVDLDDNTEAILNLDAAQVVYKNGDNIYVRDGNDAINLYQTSLTWELGEVVAGTLNATKDSYKNTPQAINVTVQSIESAGTEDVVATSSTVADAKNHLNDLVTFSFNNITTSSSSSSTYYYATSGSDKVQLYNKFGIENMDFSSLEDGKEYKVTGIIIAYNSTIEICPTEAITEVVDERDEAGIAFNPETLTITEGETFTQPTFVNPNSLTVTFESDNEDVAMWDDENNELVLMDGIGTAVITASFAGNTSYKPAEATLTVTVNKAPIVLGIPFHETFDTNEGSGGNDNSWSGSIATSDFKSDYEGWDQTNAKGANKCVKAGTGNAGGSLTTPTLPFVAGKAYVLTFKAAAWDGSKENTTLSLEASSATLSVESVEIKKGEWTDYTVTVTNATGSGTIKFYTSIGNSRFFLDEVKVEEVFTIDENSTDNNVMVANGNVQILRTFGADYWNTFMMPYNGVTKEQLMSIFGDDVKIKAVKIDNEEGYILTGVEGNTISFSDYTDYSTGEFQNSLNYIYLIKPSQDVVNPVFTNITSTAFATTMSYSSEDGNLKIVGSPNKIAMTADEGFTAYYLSTAGSLKKASATATLKGTRFYFQTKVGVEAKIFIDDEATSIEAIDNGEQASGKQEIFNLAGQRVNKAQKGIYIVNGKKVVIR